MSATMRACNMAEIVRTIIAQVKDDSATLARLCAVNSIWFDEARRALWKEPPLINLANVEDPDRRQLYANTTTFLDLCPVLKAPVWTNNKLVLTNLASLNFPRVWGVKLAPYSQGVSALVRHWFGDTVKWIEIERGLINSHTMSDLMRCRRLTHLEMGGFAHQISTDQVVNFLQAFKCLKSVRLNQPGPAAPQFPKEAIRHLVSHDSVQKLGFKRAWGFLDSTAQYLLKSPEAFRSLEQFVSAVEPVSMLRLAPRFEQLKLLHIKLLEIPGSTIPLEDAFQSISKMFTLTALEIDMNGKNSRSRFDCKALLPLADLKQLRRFVLSAVDKSMAVDETLSDEVIPRLAESWSSLSELGIVLDLPLTFGCFESIAQGCKKLTHLELKGRLSSDDFTAMVRHRGPLFPELEIFAIGGVEFETSKAGCEARKARTLLQHMPKLNRFSYMSKDETDAFLEAVCDGIGKGA